MKNSKTLEERRAGDLVAGATARVLTFTHLSFGARSPESARSVTGPDHRIAAGCLIVFLAVWAVLAVAPSYRADWLLENLLTFVAVPLAVGTYRRFRFSNQAYVQATLFLILHTIGSHYTYSEVPWGNWLRDTLGLARNHYDRIVHFGFGLLMLRPTRELCIRQAARLDRFSLGYLSVAATCFWSPCYEIIEWIVASLVDPTAGTAYLGTQGDVWDAQKDIALACAGAALAAILDGWQVRRACSLQPSRFIRWQ